MRYCTRKLFYPNILAVVPIEGQLLVTTHCSKWGLYNLISYLTFTVYHFGRVDVGTRKFHHFLFRIDV